MASSSRAAGADSAEAPDPVQDRAFQQNAGLWHLSVPLRGFSFLGTVRRWKASYSPVLRSVENPRVADVIFRPSGAWTGPTGLSCPAAGGEAFLKDTECVRRDQDTDQQYPDRTQPGKC